MVTPTRLGSAPMAKRISVIAGESETIFKPGLSGARLQKDAVTITEVIIVMIMK